MRPTPSGLSVLPTLIAYMENDAMEYVQYLYKDKLGNYYSVRVGGKNASPVTYSLSKQEAQGCYSVMSVKLASF